jgi:hypothetical protein
VEEEYEPIVLIPAAPEIPPEETEPSEKSAEKTEEKVAEEKISVTTENAAEESPFGLEDYVVDSEDDLEKSCYYIQIATLGDKKNIEAALKKYSKYPISLVPNGKGAYRVLVGPLSVDEYGAVLAKFRDAGFKDAFVRKR